MPRRTSRRRTSEVAARRSTPIATRVDHVVVAVHDLAARGRSLVERFGFHDVPLAGGEATGIVAVAAGGVTLVLVGAEAIDRPSPATSPRHGAGVQHIAVEVLNAGYARAALDAAGRPAAHRRRRRRRRPRAVLRRRRSVHRRAARLHLAHRPPGRRRRGQRARALFDALARRTETCRRPSHRRLGVAGGHRSTVAPVALSPPARARRRARHRRAHRARRRRARRRPLRSTSRVTAGKPFPAAALRGQQGRRHDHVRHRLRLRRRRVDGRRVRRRGQTGYFADTVPRRGGPARASRPTTTR